jgi:hypothetical protein
LKIWAKWMTFAIKGDVIGADVFGYEKLIIDFEEAR